jgi:phage protein D
MSDTSIPHAYVNLDGSDLKTIINEGRRLAKGLVVEVTLGAPDWKGEQSLRVGLKCEHLDHPNTPEEISIRGQKHGSYAIA